MTATIQSSSDQGLDEKDDLQLVAVRVSPHDLEIRTAPIGRQWTDERARFARRCLPLLIANQAGWEMLNPVAFTAVWDGTEAKEAIRLSADHPLSCVTSHFGFGVLTWNVPYLFRTSPGYNLLVRGPANRPKDGIGPLEGLCETDWATQTFTMNWKFTRTGQSVAFDAGEPFCLLVPQRRGELERFRPTVVELDDLPEDETRRFVSWRDDRSDFNERLLADPSLQFQGHYLRGRHIDDSQAVEHQTRLQLAPFRADSPPTSPPGEV